MISTLAIIDVVWWAAIVFGPLLICAVIVMVDAVVWPIDRGGFGR